MQQYMHMVSHVKSRSPRHDLDLSEGKQIPDLYDLAHAAGWEPCNVQDLHCTAHTCFLGWICATHILQTHKTTAG